MIRIFASRIAPAIIQEDLPQVYSLAASYALQSFRTGMPSGQPAFDGGFRVNGDEQREYCNIAHDGEWLVCIIGYVPVGIGIKRVGNLEETDIACCLSEQERCKLFSRYESVNEKLMYVFNLWTLKSSYLQTLGADQSLELPSFSLAINDQVCQLPDMPVTAGYPVMYFRRYGLDPRYKLSVCAAQGSFPASISVDENFYISQAVATASCKLKNSQ